MDENRKPATPDEPTPPNGERIYFNTPVEEDAQYNDMTEAPAEAFFAEDFSDVPLPDDAQELPALFPEAEDTPLSDGDGEPTRVERPAKRKKTKARKVLRVLCVIGKLLLGLVLAVAVLAAGLVGYLTVTEYNPAYAETAERGANNYKQKLNRTDLRILTFNTGYGGLDADADFFMDGGKSVNPASQEVVERNMIEIERILRDQDADLLLLRNFFALNGSVGQRYDFGIHFRRGFHLAQRAPGDEINSVFLILESTGDHDENLLL